ncbi:MAG TPA: DUF3052 domain-containing protein [Candidatus Stackebrandtia faecavium]|nr:DUF3052 domain-containing protein [Candidatus Stackebrandtia faecavium]
MSATAGSADEVRTLLDRLGLKPDHVIMEQGYDTDIDAPLRDAMQQYVGEFVAEDSYEIADIVVLWWRDDDGDLVDALMDARVQLADNGVVLLLTLKPGREGHVESVEVAEAAPTTGLQGTSSVNAGEDWVATRLVAPGNL